MKIPFTVPIKAGLAYFTSDAMKNSPAESARKTNAENFQWDDNVTPLPLSYYAAVALSKVFHRINPLNSILPKDVDVLMDLYPADIPLKYSVPLIKDGEYWKQAYRTKFSSNLDSDVKSWKQKYLSTYLQHYLENVNPNVFVEEEAVELTRLVSPCIFELSLNQLQMARQPPPPVPYADVVEDTCIFSVENVYDHIPLEVVVRRLFNLEEISLVFGVNNLEEKYHPRYFEFSIADCESLCCGLNNLRHFRILRINRSNLDCPKVTYILQSIIGIKSIEELDFNHCKIGDYGMKVLGGFIKHHTNLKVVRVANNCFKEVGIQGIAYALQMDPAAPIELLDFSLNSMSLECATMFSAAFVRCKKKPQTLILNACGFHGASAEKIAGILFLNRGLTRLDIAANDLSGAAEKTLIEAVENNRNILNIDLRRTNISEETQKRVDELLLRNNNLIGVERTPSPTILPLYLNEPEYLVWEYNPNNPDHIPGHYPPRIAEV